MTHIVTLKTAPTDSGLVYLATRPDMASTMGGFGPARFIGNTPPIPGVSYVIGVDDLPRFTVYCANRQVKIVDGRDVAPSARRAPWMEKPLPECSHCGQPAARGARVEHCPNCGTAWAPIEVGRTPTGYIGAVVQCGSCLRSTPTGYSHCTQCGAPLA